MANISLNSKTSKGSAIIDKGKFSGSASTESIIVSDLGQELAAIEGINGQDPTTGAIAKNKSYLGEYTNRLFGAPFQLLDSVDKRFSSINTHLGNMYLKHFMLNSPILHIRPGLPKYTGGDDPNTLAKAIQNFYMDTTIGGMSAVQSMIHQLGKGLVFGIGSKLQRRLFGFRETYYDYMQHANYMCRSMAIFMDLTSGSTGFPDGIYGSNDEYQHFSNMKWENYRMMGGTTVQSPLEYLASMAGATKLGAIGSALTSLMGAIGNSFEERGSAAADLNMTLSDDVSSRGASAIAASEAAAMIPTTNWLGAAAEGFAEGWNAAKNTTVSEVMSSKVSAVEFMVEPVKFEESITNITEQSQISQQIDSINNGIGSELAFITGSNADTGMLGSLVDFLGDATSTAVQFAGFVGKPATGGFVSHMMTGAIRSLKGQKMIYPDIYKSSDTRLDYNFTINLTSPYGDAYNRYVNIIVPLMHLLALAAPRMVTANATTSPYLVQAYIPGQCTCHLGIISNMTITKNPSGKHVSVDGFPLSVTVNFTIKELYNAFSISPANDPASFLFNETLNDYMANLAGLMPSVDTYTQQRKAMFANLDEYITSGAILNDAASPIVESAENFVNPFISR